MPRVLFLNNFLLRNTRTPWKNYSIPKAKENVQNEAIMVFLIRMRKKDQILQSHVKKIHEPSLISLYCP